MATCELTTDELKDLLQREESQQEAMLPGSTSLSRSIRAAAIIRELIERREYMAGLSRWDDPELGELERSLAWQEAYGVIDGSCAPQRGDLSDPDDLWADASDVDDMPGVAELVADSIKYLEARDLIEHHPHHPNWIRVLSEDEIAVEVSVAEFTPSEMAAIVAADPEGTR